LWVRGFDGGGAQRDAVLLCNELDRREIPVALVTAQASGPLLDLVAPSVPVFDLGNGRKLRLALALGALRSLIAVGHPAALVSSEAAANVLTVLAARLGRNIHTKIILREVASPLQAKDHDPYWQNRLGYRLVRFAYPRADLVLTFTEGVRTDLVNSFGVPEDKIFSLGTNAVLTAAMQSRIRNLGRTPEPGSIVALGRLSPEKNYACLVEAFAILHRSRGAHLTIIGEGSERPRLEALIAERGLSKDVTLAGHQSDPLPYLVRAALFVSSSMHEGFGNALIEAMTCGVPIVATDAPHGPGEILRGGQFGRLVPVGDAAALATAMARALDASSDPAALRAHAQTFTVEAATDKFLAALDTIGLRFETTSPRKPARMPT
jgi:glycosyltransferase involved in cell wall biosynthesis